MSEMNNDDRRKRLEFLFRWGIAGVGLIVLTPLMFLLLKGIAVAMALGVAGAVGFTSIFLAPLFSFKLANWRMKMMIAEVEDNPIETLQNLRVEKQAELERADQKIVDFDTEVRNYDDSVRTFQSEYPEEAESYKVISENMHQALENMKTEKANAQANFNDLIQKIKKGEAIYKMSMAAQKVTQLSKTAQAQVFAEIKQQVAFDTIKSQLNRSFASLSQAVESRKATRGELPEHKAGEAIVIPQKSTVAEVGR